MIRIIQYKITFGVILFFIPLCSFAQLPMGAKALSLGQATSALPEYEWALFSNPALANAERITLGFYGLRNYGFPELTDIAAFGSVPTGVGVVSGGFLRYGDNLFNETRIRAGFKSEWHNLHFGAVANYNHISFGGDYGSGGALGFDVGVAAEIMSQFWIGAKSTNINQTQYNGIEDDLARELAIGFSYSLNDLAMLAMDVVKDVRFPVSYRGGLEVKVIDNLHGRIGITTEPITYAFGFGYRQPVWEVNLAVQRHELLGFSPGMDLLFFF